VSGLTVADTRERKLLAEAARLRREAERAQARSLAAEHAVAGHKQAQRVQRHLDAHPTRAPSPEGLVEWEAIRGRIRELVDAPTWRCWCELVHAHRRRTDGVWVLACPAPIYEWVKVRFGTAWEYACQSRCEFVICDQSTLGERSPA
jgi:hypothetical protein